MKRRFFIKTTVNKTLGLIFILPGFKHFFEKIFVESSTKTDYSQLFDMPDLIKTPDNSDEWSGFRKLLKEWRHNIRNQIAYDGSLYDNPDFKWVKSAFNCYFLMMNDEVFYNWRVGKYRIEEFIKEIENDFGRIDLIVLWHAYPRIGLDNRNQFDFYKEMPGGLEALKNISNQFHQKEIKVCINYNPWDTGTRREMNSDVDMLVELVKEIDADGIFLDTMNFGATEFRKKLDSIKSGVALESELSLPVNHIYNHHMSWAQWFSDSYAPGILRNKWIERRHMQHSVSRWKRDRTNELHTAWMNGSGIMIWENVFGQWVGWNERDKSILKSMSPIQKRFSNVFSGEGWIPMSNKSFKKEIFVNQWYSEGLRLWTLVNRSEKYIEGEILKFDRKIGEKYYDLIKGTEIIPNSGQKEVIVSDEFYPRGIGCFLAGKPELLKNDFNTFLANQSKIYQTRKITTEFPHKETFINTFTYKKPVSLNCSKMVEIPVFHGELEVIYRIREVGFYESIQPYFIDIGAPQLHQLSNILIKADLKRFLIDEAPVTNIEFKKFLEESEYKPKILQNFLKHWISGEIPPNKENHPVVYIDINDARAYANWAGKRLPTELEWQFAGQGYDKLKYPWGNRMKAGCCNNGEINDTTEVKAYPSGKSVFDCYDLCGNTWELTESEYSDSRNHFCILKGGSYYKAHGSEWYFDGGPQPLSFSAKKLLFFPGIDRCSTVGFRCALSIS